MFFKRWRVERRLLKQRAEEREAEAATGRHMPNIDVAT
jgi:hypothetical protein